jgi:UDP-glucose 4-epimerase
MGTYSVVAVQRSRGAHRNEPIGRDPVTRVVVVGATGNTGVAVVDALSAEAEVTSVVGLSRRGQGPPTNKVEWCAADVTTDDLGPHLAGADAVIHLAWLIQPSHDEAMLWATNVEGTARVLAAASAAGVPAVVVASSVGAYSPGPKDRAVDESWPTNGVATSSYSRQKAYVERMLDCFELEHSDTRVVRLRPGLVFQRDSGTEIRRYFLGPFVPTPLLDPRWLALFPDIPGLVIQAVHARDLADAYRAAVLQPVRGAFNVAAEPVLDPNTMASALGARRVPLPAAAARTLAAATWRLRLQPTEPGWLDLGLAAPLMDITRARRELRWVPRRSSTEALVDMLGGAGSGVGADSEPLRPDGPSARADEIRTGVGARSRSDG